MRTRNEEKSNLIGKITHIYIYIYSKGGDEGIPQS